MNQESNSPIVSCRVDRGLLDGEERSNWLGSGVVCSVARLPVRSGTRTRGLSTAEAVSGTRGRDGELGKDSKRVVLDDGR